MITPETLLGALVVFALRLINNSISTVSVIVTMRQQRALAATLTFFESLVWALVIANIIKDLDNWLTLLAYASGFSAGSYVGMRLEESLITTYMQATLTLKTGGHELARKLRERGYGVTESLGEGRDGPVTLLHSVCVRQKLPNLLKTVQELDPKAFVSVEEIRAVQRGWLPSAKRPDEGGD